MDPLAHDLLFERFLNPERVSLPDFDIDFCIDGRDRVIDYVGQRYGRERVAQIATYGTMAARAVVRDVGRALGMPYGYVDRIAKLIPFEIGITLDKAIADDEELRGVYQNDEEVRGLIDLAKRLEGLARNVGTHAGGVVIAPKPITEYMPLYADADGALLTQLDKDDLEAIGLIKFDFLGLKTLTIIDKAVATINRERAGRGEPPLNVDAIPVDDAKTYELLRQCRTTAVFQLESLGMRDLIKRLQPDRFDDLTAIVALFRPGPMQMADEFIARKHRAGATPDYLHPQPRGDAEADVRRDPLSRAGHADRADSGGLLARRRGSAAARHGQEEARGDGRAARRVPEGCDGARRRGGRARTTSSIRWRRSRATASTSRTPRPTR